jgi:non-heme chloroperoxidase
MATSTKGVTMSYIETSDKTKLFYTDWGQGAPVILIHGWPVNSDMWEYQSQALIDAGYRVIAYDRRGFGRSSKPLSGYDYNTFAADLNELITKLDLQKVSLVGFSMGGGEIARYLSRYGSERVAKTVLVSSVVPYMLKTDSNPDGVEEKVFTQITDGLKEDRPKFLAGFFKQFFGEGLLSKPVSDETLQWSAFLAYQASAKATIDCVTAFGKTDFRTDLAAFKIPTLVIHGTADKTVPIKTAGEAAAHSIKGAIWRPYEGAPHGLFMTHKEQLRDDLVSFLQTGAVDTAGSGEKRTQATGGKHPAH